MISSKEIQLRLRGFSPALFASNWHFTEREKTIVRQLIVRLEDRRVLFVPYDVESIVGTIESINEIRKELNRSLEDLSTDAIDQTIRSLRDMRRACHEYLKAAERIRDSGGNVYQNLCFKDQVDIASSLERIRTIFGVHLANLCITYSIDIEEGLASIMPLETSPDTDK